MFSAFRITIVKLPLNAKILEPISHSFDCFGTNEIGRIFLLGVTVSVAVRLS